MSDVKRLNYFNNQFLEERDFKDEQRYHIEMRRLHNRLLHSWGVAYGLQVEKAGHQAVTLQPGMALDNLGREIVVAAAVNKELSGHAANSNVYLSLSYAEALEDEDRQEEGSKNHTRVRELAVIDVHKQRPPTDGSVVAVARVEFDAEARVREIDTSVRKSAMSIVGPRSITGEELQDFVVTEQKLAEEVRSKLSRSQGWVRLPFKPNPVERVRVDQPEAEVRDVTPDYDTVFISGAAYSRCGIRGARGAMGIPVPVAARRLRGLRVAGWARAVIEVSLFRTGWRNDRCEEVELNSERVNPPAGGYFNQNFLVDHKLGDDDALAVMLVAKGAARIFFVAAEFQ